MALGENAHQMDREKILKVTQATRSHTNKITILQITFSSKVMRREHFETSSNSRNNGGNVAIAGQEER